MAIIYSYENENELKRSDKLVGTATSLYNGRVRRVTKNFTIGELSDFIAGGNLTLSNGGTTGPATLIDNILNIPIYQGAITLTTSGTSGVATLTGNTLNIPNYTTTTPTLQSVTNNGNTTTNTIDIAGFTAGFAFSDGYSIGAQDIENSWYSVIIPFVGLQTYDTSYNSVVGSEEIFVFSNDGLNYSSIKANGSLNLKKNGGSLGTLSTNTLTQARSWNLPNASGTIALTSDIPSVTGYVPYTGATGNVNLGNNDIYVAKYWMYDEPNDGYGSMHLTDGVFHVEDVDGHSMITFEDAFFTFAKSSTIRALLNVSNITVNRDYLFPDASGTIALTSDLSGYVPYIGATSNLNIAPYDLYAGDIYAGAWNGDVISLSSGGTGATTAAGARANLGAGTVNSVAALTLGTTGTDLSSSVATGTTDPVITLNVPTASATKRGALSSADWTTFNNKQNSLGYTPYRYVNATQSIGSNSTGETQLIRVTIPANSFSTNDIIKIKLRFSKTGLINANTLRMKMSTSASMPSAGASQIATVTMANTSTYTPFERLMGISAGNLKGYSFTTSNVTDLAATANNISSVAFDVTQTQYLYVSVNPAAITTDVTYLETIEITN